MLVSPSTSSSRPTSADEAALLGDLADASDALTAALVAHDFDAITAATRAAERLCRALESVERQPGRRRRRRAEHEAVIARIGATARRNAVLLESAWATDAAVLRLLVAAAADQAEGKTTYQQAAPSAAPVGWLDRSA